MTKTSSHVPSTYCGRRTNKQFRITISVFLIELKAELVAHPDANRKWSTIYYVSSKLILAKKKPSFAINLYAYKMQLVCSFCQNTTEHCDIYIPCLKPLIPISLSDLDNSNEWLND